MNRRTFEDIDLANEKIDDQRKTIYALRQKLIDIRKILDREVKV